MELVFVYNDTDDENKLKIFYPIGDVDFTKNPPHLSGMKGKWINKNKVPTDRQFRNEWKLNKTKVELDSEKLKKRRLKELEKAVQKKIQQCDDILSDEDISERKRDKFESKKEQLQMKLDSLKTNVNKMNIEQLKDMDAIGSVGE